MRRLTYEGFLEKYICELSGLNTSSVSKTLKVLPDNPRILEPLALYAVMTNVSYNIISKNKDFMSECSMLKEHSDSYSELPGNYQKLYKAYIYASSKKSREDDTKKLMHKQIHILLNNSGISTYRVSKDLQIDVSNCNAFIKNCDCDRLSKSDVERIWRHLQKIEKEKDMEYIVTK